MVGADTSDFFDALNKPEKGLEVSLSWSKTARRFNDEFSVSVGFLNGKRCLGGFLELLMHCHYLVSIEDGVFGMPEVTLPVVPGMEGCHWPFRKTEPKNWMKILSMLLSGEMVKAKDSVGWLIDYAGSMEDSLRMAWNIAADGDHKISKRIVKQEALKNKMPEVKLPNPGDPLIEAARKAIFDCVKASCESTLADALTVQAKHSSNFMSSNFCQKGSIGKEAVKIMNV
jgi:enoyl-CoA hydratase/carnithine racemase